MPRDMRYVPFLLLPISFALGFFGLPVFSVLALAVLSAILLMQPRARALREQPQAPDQNKVLDFAFLLFSQVLIHIVAGALGLFIARMMAA